MSDTLPLALTLSTHDLVPVGCTFSVKPWPSVTVKRFSRGLSAAIFFSVR